MPDFKMEPYKQRADRAKQFMPFAALKGYYDLVRQRERVVQPRHELTEEEAREVSGRLSSVRKRTLCKVVYYDTDAYITCEGMVSDIDYALRTITIVRTCISFEDILDVQPKA